MTYLRRLAKSAASIALTLSLLPLLGGCFYDYTQRTDRVAHSAGNAVKANLEQSTINPSSKNMNSTTGLGKNGPVMPEPTE